MKQIAAIFALILGPTVFAAQSQERAVEPAPQASNHNAGSTSSKATSHDRHARKHRASGHHHRHRTTTKSHNS
jgi:hypothetical protein